MAQKKNKKEWNCNKNKTLFTQSIIAIIFSIYKFEQSGKIKLKKIKRISSSVTIILCTPRPRKNINTCIKVVESNNK